MVITRRTIRTGRQRVTQIRGLDSSTITRLKQIQRQKEQELFNQRRIMQAEEEEKAKTLAQKQSLLKNLINSIQSDIKEYQRERETALSNAREASNLSREIKYESRAYGYKKRIEEAGNLLSEIKQTSKLYDYNSLDKYIKNYGNTFRDVKKKQLVGERVAAPQVKRDIEIKQVEVTPVTDLITNYGEALTSGIQKTGFLAKDTFLVNGKVQKLSIDPRKVLTPKKAIEISKLPEEKRNIVYNYANIKNAVIEANKLSTKEINELKKLSNTIAEFKDLKVLFKKDLPNIINTSDLKNISNLKKLKEKDIVSIVSRNNYSNVIKQIASLNKLANTSEKAIKNLLDKYSDSVIKDIKDIFKVKRVDIKKSLNPSNKNPFITKKLESIVNRIKQTGKYSAKSFNTLVRFLTLGNIEKKLNNNEQITTKEYKFYNNMLKDIFGVKEFTKNTLESLKKDYGNNGVRGIASSLIVGAARAGLTAGEFTKDTFLFLYDITNKALKLGRKPALDFALESADILKDYSKIATKVRLEDKIKETEKIVGKKYYQNTENRLRKLAKGVASGAKTIAQFGNEVIKDPRILLIGILVGSTALITKIRKEITTDPAKALGFLLSFLLDDYVFEKIGEIYKFAKYRYSPFVLRNISIYGDAPSIRTTGKALKTLEGKKIDIFHTTPDDLRGFFKGTQINKKELDFLIKDMLKNPEIYIGKNLKLKKIDTIAKTRLDKKVIELMRDSKNVFLSGSASLKLQLKKFRKIGDLDVISKNPKLFAKKLASDLNKNSLLNKSRYKINKTPDMDVYRIWDSGITGKNKYNAKRVVFDVDGLKLFEEGLGRKIKPSDFRKIQGINVFKAEPQLAKKLKLAIDPGKVRRSAKEIQDVKLLLSKVDRGIGQKRYNLVRKLLDKEKGVLKVVPTEVGLDRQYSWARKYLPDINLGFKYDYKKVLEINKRLKKLGFTQKQISANISRYSATGLYFSPNTIYSDYLLKGLKKAPNKFKGGIMFTRQQKISKYPPKIQKLLDDNFKGLLDVKGQSKLRGLMRDYINKNPNKIFVGEKALADTIGESEVIAGTYSKFFPRKTIIKREIYLPAFDKFIKAQEVVLGKKPTPILKKLVNSFKNKFKKGYKVSDMKKDILKWAQSNIDDFKRLAKSKKAQLNFIENQKKLIDDQIEIINKSKLPIQDKKSIINALNQRRRALKITKRVSKATIAAQARKVNNLVRSVVKPRNIKRLSSIKREIARLVVKKTIRPRPRVTPRPKKRVTKKITPRPRPRPTTRPRVRPTVRPRTRPITRPRPRVTPRPKPKPKPPKKPPKRILKPKLDWDLRLKSGESRIVNVIIRVKGKNKEIPLRTTPNRALNRIIKLIDNTTSRSFQLKIIGKKKIKDIKKPSLTKFRMKKSKGSPVLRFVEKSKYAIDTAGEKKGLKISKFLKKRNKRSRK